MPDPMQEAIRRVLAGEPCKTVARELGVPESSVRWNIQKLGRPPGVPPAAQIKAQVQAQGKTLDLDDWLDGARVIRLYLVREVSRRLQREPQKLRDLLVAFGIISDKIHQAEALLQPVVEAQAVASVQTTVVLKVQQGEGKAIDLVEFIGDPPPVDERAALAFPNI